MPAYIKPTGHNGVV